MNFNLLKKKALEAYNKHGIFVRVEYEPLTSIWTIKFSRYLGGGKCGWSQVRKILTDADICEAFEMAYEKLSVDNTISYTSYISDQEEK